MTTRRFLGISRLRFLRLCSRAPRTEMTSMESLTLPEPDRVSGKARERRAPPLTTPRGRGNFPRPPRARATPASFLPTRGMLCQHGRFEGDSEGDGDEG